MPQINCFYVVFFKAGNFTTKLKKNRIRNYEDVIGNIKSGKEVLVDARDHADFLKGHIPKSVNLPFKDLFQNGTQKLKDLKHLKERTIL